jgi:hypothetical protein
LQGANEKGVAEQNTEWKPSEKRTDQARLTTISITLAKQNCIRAVALQHTLCSGQTSTKQLQQSRQLAAHVHGREKNFFFTHEKIKYIDATDRRKRNDLSLIQEKSCSMIHSTTSCFFQTQSVISFLFFLILFYLFAGPPSIYGNTPHRRDCNGACAKIERYVFFPLLPAE